MTNDTKSSLNPDTSGIACGSVLWTMHQHLSDGAEHSFSRFAGDAKLQRGVTAVPDDCPVFLRNLEGLEKWDSRNLMKFITGKHKALYLGRNHLMDWCTLWGTWLETSFMRKSMRVLVVETKPAMHSHSKEGQLQLGSWGRINSYMMKNIASSSRELILSFCSSPVGQK